MKRLLCGIGVLCMLVLLIGFGVKRKRDGELLAYQEDLKRYARECNAFSEEEKEIICIAVEHIETPEVIDNNQLISVYRLSQKYSSENKLDLRTEDGEMIGLNDWRVDIGDTSAHRNFSAIIDGETLEFVMQIPIA